MSARLNGDEVYRITQQHGAHWLWCDRHRINGGDNIDLVREIEPGTGFAEAVFRLSGAPTLRPQPRLIEPLRQPPSLPSWDPEDVDIGRSYPSP